MAIETTGVVFTANGLVMLNDRANNDPRKNPFATRQDALDAIDDTVGFNRVEGLIMYYRENYKIVAGIFDAQGETFDVNNDDHFILFNSLEDLQAEFEEQEVIKGGVYNNFQVEGNIIVCTNTDGKAVFTGFNISEDYKIIHLINNSNFEIQIDNESSSSLEENQISLPNNTVSVGLQGTTVFAYITKGGLNKWQIIDVFGSRYMPEHKGLTEDAAVVVSENSVSGSKQIVNLYDSDPSITSATLTDAELNIRVPGRVVGFELICENAGDNGIVYKLVNDTTGVWKKFILT